MKRINASLDFEFHVIGAVSDLEVPKLSSQSGPKSGLWTGTCFEIFLKKSSSDSYHEWNFSPSGDWAFHSFIKYRTPDSNPLSLRMMGPIEVQLSDTSLYYRNRIPTEGADRLHPCVVLKKKDGSLSYWASEIQEPQPDFHLISLYKSLDEIV